MRGLLRLDNYHVTFSVEACSAGPTRNVQVKVLTHGRSLKVQRRDDHDAERQVNSFGKCCRRSKGVKRAQPQEVFDASSQLRRNSSVVEGDPSARHLRKGMAPTK